MQPQEILEFLKTRRSVRKFSDRPVNPALIWQILEAGRWAPSGRNNQPWRFAVVTRAEVKEKIGALSHYGKMIQAASVVIPVFVHKPSMYHEVKDYQSIGACLENMWLMAHGLGLGAVWVGEILKNADTVRQVLGLGPELELMAVFLVGWPQKAPEISPRRPLGDLILESTETDDISAEN